MNTSALYVKTQSAHLHTFACSYMKFLPLYNFLYYFIFKTFLFGLNTEYQHFSTPQLL